MSRYYAVLNFLIDMRYAHARFLWCAVCQQDMTASGLLPPQKWQVKTQAVFSELPFYSI
jgi:hypothetical protein